MLLSVKNNRYESPRYLRMVLEKEYRKRDNMHEDRHTSASEEEPLGYKPDDTAHTYFSASTDSVYLFLLLFSSRHILRKTATRSGLGHNTQRCFKCTPGISIDARMRGCLLGHAGIARRAWLGTSVKKKLRIGHSFNITSRPIKYAVVVNHEA